MIYIFIIDSQWNRRFHLVAIHNVFAWDENRKIKLSRRENSESSMNASRSRKINSSSSYLYEDWRFVKFYVEFLRDYAMRKNDFSSKINFSFTIASLKKLIVTTFWILLNRFDRIFIRVNKSSLIDDMINLRNREFNAHHLIFMMKRTDDFVIEIDLKKIRYICFDSLKLRYILHLINIYVLSFIIAHNRRKLLLCEDISLFAQFWKMTINLIYVETIVLHFHLINSERITLIKRFNDSTDDFIILIIMHVVSIQRINLDKCCSRMIIVINVINAFQKWQDWKKILRVCHQTFIFEHN
jgi:hypothetical protein